MYFEQANLHDEAASPNGLADQFQHLTTEDRIRAQKGVGLELHHLTSYDKMKEAVSLWEPKCFPSDEVLRIWESRRSANNR
ncbi:hypothetical protein FRC02_010930 [Tulasnella sp. 418]|nr:hypothetical protein FRC02_010930 [Tulasnella sp. 418]